MGPSPVSFTLRTRLDVPRKGWLFLIVPDELLGGVRRRVWLDGTLNGRPFVATANPWKGDTHVVTINRHMRAALGIDGPVEVVVRATVSDIPLLDLPVPPDLARAIGHSPAARMTFESLPPSRKKEFVFYVDEVRRPATRSERIRRSVAVLERGRHLWEDPAHVLADDLKTV